MPRFPRSEPEIAALALVVTQGLAPASEDFPTPPVPADELQGRLDAYNAAREQHAAKDDALEELVDGVKANLRYAGIAVRDHPLPGPCFARGLQAAEGRSHAALRARTPVASGEPFQ